MGPLQVLSLWDREDLGVMARKRYSTLPNAWKLKPYYQMQFSVIPMILLLLCSLTPLSVYSNPQNHWNNIRLIREEKLTDFMAGRMKILSLFWIFSVCLSLKHFFLLDILTVPRNSDLRIFAPISLQTCSELSLTITCLCNLYIVQRRLSY